MCTRLCHRMCLLLRLRLCLLVATSVVVLWRSRTLLSHWSSSGTFRRADRRVMSLSTMATVECRSAVFDLMVVSEAGSAEMLLMDSRLAVLNGAVARAYFFEVSALFAQKTEVRRSQSLHLFARLFV